MRIFFDVKNNKVKAKIIVNKENIYSYEVVTRMEDSYAEVYLQLRDNVEKAIVDLKEFKKEIEEEFNIETTFHRIKS